MWFKILLLQEIWWPEWFHYISVIMVIFKKTNDRKCSWECVRKKETFKHYLLEWKLVQNYVNHYGKIWQKLIVRILFNKPQHFWESKSFYQKTIKAHSCCCLLDWILCSKRWWLKRRSCSSGSESLLSLASLRTWKYEF